MARAGKNPKTDTTYAVDVQKRHGRLERERTRRGRQKEEGRKNGRKKERGYEDIEMHGINFRPPNADVPERFN